MHVQLDREHSYTVKDVLYALSRWALYINTGNPDKLLHKQFGKAKRMELYKSMCKYRHSKKSKWIGNIK